MILALQALRTASSTGRSGAAPSGPRSGQALQPPDQDLVRTAIWAASLCRSARKTMPTRRKQRPPRGQSQARERLPAREPLPDAFAQVKRHLRSHQQPQSECGAPQVPLKVTLLRYRSTRVLRSKELRDLGQVFTFGRDLGKSGDPGGCPQVKRAASTALCPGLLGALLAGRRRTICEGEFLEFGEQGAHFPGVVEPGLVVGELVVGEDAGDGLAVDLAGPLAVGAVQLRAGRRGSGSWACRSGSCAVGEGAGQGEAGRGGELGGDAGGAGLLGRGGRHAAHCRSRGSRALRAFLTV